MFSEKIKLKLMKRMLGTDTKKLANELLAIEQEGTVPHNLPKWVTEFEEIKLNEVCSTVGEQLVHNEKVEEYKNMAECIKYAMQESQNLSDDDVSEEEIPLGFWGRWRREAKVISDEYLQMVWGKILAEEIKEPHSVSYRALDIIKNMTKTELNLFRDVLRFSVEKRFIIGKVASGIFGDESNILKNLLKLQGAGLLQATSATLLTIGENRGYEELGKGICINNYVAFPKDEKATLALPVIPLTPVGVELFRIADVECFPKEYLKALLSINFQTQDNSSTIAEVRFFEELSPGVLKEIKPSEVA